MAHQRRATTLARHAVDDIGGELVVGEAVYSVHARPDDAAPAGVLKELP
jgi:hypothetical protein